MNGIEVVVNIKLIGITGKIYIYIQYIVYIILFHCIEFDNK